MIVEVFLNVNGEIMKGELEFSFKDTNDTIIKRAFEESKKVGGDIVWMTIKSNSKWLLLRKIKLESRIESHIGFKTLNDSFNALKKEIGIDTAKSFLIDLIDENSTKTENYLKELKIK